MMGLEILVKKIKLLKQEESVQVLEIIQYTFQTLTKHNLNEYMIEWIRKVIDSIIEDDNFCGFLGSGLK